MVQILIIALLSLVFLSCGVRGKPLPPLEPTSIGDGKIKAVDEDNDGAEEVDEVFRP